MFCFVLFFHILFLSAIYSKRDLVCRLGHKNELLLFLHSHVKILSLVFITFLKVKHSIVIWLKEEGGLWELASLTSSYFAAIYGNCAYKMSGWCWEAGVLPYSQKL